MRFTFIWYPAILTIIFMAGCNRSSGLPISPTPDPIVAQAQATVQAALAAPVPLPQPATPTEAPIATATGAATEPPSATDTPAPPDLAASATAESQVLEAAIAATLTMQAAERVMLDALNTAVAATLTAQPTSTALPAPAASPTPLRTLRPATLPAPTASPTPSRTLRPATLPTSTPTPTPDIIAASMTNHGPQTLSWIAIPAGDFVMGSSEDEIWAAVDFCNQSEGNCQFGWFDDELPRRIASTDAYQINRYEITNAQYNVCALVGVCPPAGRIVSDTNIPYDPIFFADAYPVVAVSKNDAAAYCVWAGGRLPSEAEWEKAARGPSTGSGSGRIYPWGDDFRWDAVQISASAPAPVGSLPGGASPYGALDMAGNAFEWTDSAENGNYVLRGGGWHSYPFRARSADRGTKLPAAFANYDIGFRCAR